MPPHRVVGEKARLICKFDMEGDILYSVKWYKDDLEFYRFVPNDRPKLQVFPQEGIHVDVSILISIVLLVRNYKTLIGVYIDIITISSKYQSKNANSFSLDKYCNPYSTSVLELDTKSIYTVNIAKNMSQCCMYKMNSFILISTQR